MKRKLWITLALAALIAALWCGTAGAYTSERFLSGPEGGGDLHPGESLTLTWETSFEPRSFQMMISYRKKNSSGESVQMVKEVGGSASSCTITYDEMESALKPIPNDANIWGLKIYAIKQNTNILASGLTGFTFHPRVFSVQPEGGTLDPSEVHTLTWETNFTPTKIEITSIYQSKSSNNRSYAVLKTLPGTATNGTVAYQEALRAARNAPTGTKPVGMTIRAYYNDEDFLASRVFYLSLNPLSLQVEDPASSVSADAPLTIHYQANFLPQKVELILGSSYVAKTIEQPSSFSFPVTYEEVISAVNAASGRFWQLVATFDSDITVTSGYFSIDYGEPAFSLQPKSGSYDADQKTYTVTWKNNFTPLYWYLRDLTADTHEFLPGNSTSQNSYDLPFEYRNHKMRVDAFFGTGADDYISSATFSGDTESFAFIRQPASGSYDPQLLYFVTEWETTFTPVKVEVWHDYEKHFTKSNSNEKGFEKITPMETSLEKAGRCSFVTDVKRNYAYDRHLLRVFYDVGEDDYITSESFKVDVSALKVITNISDIRYVPDASELFAVESETNFFPVKVELRADGEVLKTIKPEGQQKNFSFTVEPEKPKEITNYAIAAYYTETQYVYGYILAKPYRFSLQPRDATYDSDPPYTTYWRVDYSDTPVNILVLRTDEEGNVLNETPQFTVVNTYNDADRMYYTRVTLDETLSSANFRIFAGMAESSVYIVSDVFAVIRKSFTTQPASGVYLGESGFTVNWALNFTPQKTELIRRGNSGTETIYKELSGTSYTFTEPESGTWFLRAYSQGSEYVDSLDFTIMPKEPKFTKVPEGGTLLPGKSMLLDWNVNFMQVKAEILWATVTNHAVFGMGSSADGVGDYSLHELIEGSVTETTEYADTGSGNYYLFIIRSYYDSAHYVESKPFRILEDAYLLTFDNNGGSDAFDLVWLDQTKYPTRMPMNPVAIWAGFAESKNCMLPICTIIPPEGKMFDAWEIDGVRYADGDTFGLTRDAIARPLWKDRTFGTKFVMEDRPYNNEPVEFFVHQFLDPYIPADMVPYTAQGNKNPYEPNIRILWYQIVNGSRELTSQYVFASPDVNAPGGVYFQAMGPGDAGDYELVVTYQGTEVISQFFSITGNTSPQGNHSYQLNSKLDKEYDGIPVEFDPYKGLSIDGGKMSWAELEKMGETRFLWRMFDGKGYLELKEAPSEIGQYQLVIQERDQKEKEEIWNDAAVFDFEIAKGAPSSFTVTFDVRGGLPEIAPQTVTSGGIAEEPAVPTKIGAVFTGWYTDSSCSKESQYHFKASVETDMTLYAGWLVPKPNGILKLPVMLTSLEDEAFSGAAAEAVIIPPSVTTITGNPFAGSRIQYIYGYIDSTAKTFADSYPAYTFIPIDDGWMAGK